MFLLLTIYFVNALVISVEQTETGLFVNSLPTNTLFWEANCLPILFVHHERDACINTRPSESLLNFRKVKEFTKSDVQYITISSGESEHNDPYWSGYHMYFSVGPELSKALDNFLSKYY